MGWVRWTLLPCALLIAMRSWAAPVELESPDTRATLLELYTSEGCSSCPPADRWLSGLRDDPRLWRELVPVAFHVDYWDYIGWPDRFARAAHSQRQHSYASSGRVGSVYTPGFVVDGREWRGWFRGRKPQIGSGMHAGVLGLEVDGERIAARFDPQGEARDAGQLELHVARLGFGLTTEVGAGENAGRALRHDFVVLDYRRVPLIAGDRVLTAGFTLPLTESGAERHAVAAWVTPRGDQAVLQAVGGWLPPPGS